MDRQATERSAGVVNRCIVVGRQKDVSLRYQSPIAIYM